MARVPLNYIKAIRSKPRKPKLNQGTRKFKAVKEPPLRNDVLNLQLKHFEKTKESLSYSKALRMIKNAKKRKKK